LGVSFETRKLGIFKDWATSVVEESSSAESMSSSPLCVGDNGASNAAVEVESTPSLALKDGGRMDEDESSRGNSDCDAERLCGGLEFLSVKVSESSCVGDFVLWSKDFDVRLAL